MRLPPCAPKASTYPSMRPPVVGPIEPQARFSGFWRGRRNKRYVFHVFRHRFAVIRCALMFAWAISRATTIGPLNDKRVPMGRAERYAGLRVTDVQIQLNGLAPFSTRCESGINLPGLCSSFSSQIPCLLILALMLRSAEQERAMAIGQEPPWRGKRITRISGKAFAAKLRADAKLAAGIGHSSASVPYRGTPDPAHSRW